MVTVSRNNDVHRHALRTRRPHWWRHMVSYPATRASTTPDSLALSCPSLPLHLRATFMAPTQELASMAERTPRAPSDILPQLIEMVGDEIERFFYTPDRDFALARSTSLPGPADRPEEISLAYHGQSPDAADTQSTRRLRSASLHVQPRPSAISSLSLLTPAFEPAPRTTFARRNAVVLSAPSVATCSPTSSYPSSRRASSATLPAPAPIVATVPDAQLPPDSSSGCNSGCSRIGRNFALQARIAQAVEGESRAAAERDEAQAEMGKLKQELEQLRAERDYWRDVGWEAHCARDVEREERATKRSIWWKRLSRRK